MALSMNVTMYLSFGGKIIIVNVLKAIIKFMEC